MRRTFVSLTLALSLMLLALPAAASPGAGFALPGSSIVEKVMDAFSGLIGVAALDVTVSHASEARAKDHGGVDTPPTLFYRIP